jgi:hypothetical protein
MKEQNHIEEAKFFLFINRKRGKIGNGKLAAPLRKKIHFV